MTALHQFGAEMLKLSKRLESFPAAATVTTATPSTASTTMDGSLGAASTMNYSSVLSTPRPMPTTTSRLIRSSTNASIEHRIQPRNEDYEPGSDDNYRQQQRQYRYHADDIPAGGNGGGTNADPTTNSVVHYYKPAAMLPFDASTATPSCSITRKSSVNPCSILGGGGPLAPATTAVSAVAMMFQSPDSPTSIEHCRNAVDRQRTSHRDGDRSRSSRSSSSSSSTCKSEAHQGTQPHPPPANETTLPSLSTTVSLVHDDKVSVVAAPVTAAKPLHSIRYANVPYY